MWIIQSIVNFLGLDRLIELINAHQVDFSIFKTSANLEAFISPIAPLVLILEIGLLIWLDRGTPVKISKHYKIPLMMFVTNAVVPVYLILRCFILVFNFFSQYALFTVDSRPIYFIYAFVIWELSHFIFHYSCHNVRILWVLHSPHHAPAKMNLAVIHTGFILQGFYAAFVRAAICAFLGVPLQLLILAVVIDGCWGTLIHLSEELWPAGKPGGLLGKILLWPSDHRVHHANNPQYIDKNYCNTLPIWDLIFGTLRREIPGIKPQYGLARKVNQDSFIDTYFGEVNLLIRDIKNAGSVKDVFYCLLMPPGFKVR